MKKINNSDFEFDKYEKQIEKAKYYRSISHFFTVYTGFDSKDHNGIYVLKISDKLEIYESDSSFPFDIICNLEGKHSQQAFNIITWKDLSGEEQSRFMGA